MPTRRKLDPEFATTEDLMNAAGVARRTIIAWLDQDLLPRPVKISLGPSGGVFNRFPAQAIERARFIAEKRAAGYTYQEIADMLDRTAVPAATPPTKPPTSSRR